MSNPVSYVDTTGHSCSSGSVESGTEGACADAMNDYCEKHHSDGRCAGHGPSNPVKGSDYTPVPAPGAVKGDPTWTNGVTTNRPTPTVTVYEPTYGKAAQLASFLDGVGAALVPGGQGYSEAREETLFASDRCKLMRSYGNGPLGGKACSDAYGAIPMALIPPFGFGAGTASKTLSKDVARGTVKNVERSAVDDLVPPGHDPATWTRDYGTREGTTDLRWRDPAGGEWRMHSDARHEPHWDYNPWNVWNSPWQNRTLDGGEIPK